MALGPIELVVLRFPGNQFRGEIIPALQELVEGGIIRIVDIIFLHKSVEGKLTVLEIDDLEAEMYGMFNPIISDVSGLLSSDDAERLGSALEDNSSAAIMLFENAWAARFVEAVLNAKGELVMNERIPRAVIDELLAAQAAN
jgi:hypothetical protein